MERISVREEPRGGASSKVTAERACKLCLGDGLGVPVLKVGLREGVVGSRLQRWEVMLHGAWDAAASELGLVLVGGGGALPHGLQGLSSLTRELPIPHFYIKSILKCQTGFEKSCLGLMVIVSLIQDFNNL